MLKSRFPIYSESANIIEEIATTSQLKINGVEYIPKGAIVTPKRIIAGFGSSEGLRVAERLSEVYGGDALKWSKYVGQIESSKYIFDIHWYYNLKIGSKEFKIKNYKVKK